MTAAILGLAALLLAADPASDEALARTAIETARSAVDRADAGTRASAEKLLSEAVEHQRAARHAAARRKADEVWHLITGGSGPPSSFTVLVSDAGTQVAHTGGQAISVEDDRGTTRVLSGGEKTVVGKGTLPAPSLLSPGEQARIALRPTGRGLGPVTLTWKPVSGAKEYEVEYQVDRGKPAVLRVQRPEIRLPPLPQGRVAWAVRSISDEATSELSARRWFELEAEELKLEVKGSGWK